MTFTKKQEEILLKAVEVFGKGHQEDMAIEEMGELLQAIIKNRRAAIRLENGNTEGYAEAVLNYHEEIADVLIVLEQIRLTCTALVDRYVNEKIERLNKRIEAERNKI